MPCNHILNTVHHTMYRRKALSSEFFREAFEDPREDLNLNTLLTVHLETGKRHRVSRNCIRWFIHQDAASILANTSLRVPRKGPGVSIFMEARAAAKPNDS